MTAQSVVASEQDAVRKRFVRRQWRRRIHAWRWLIVLGVLSAAVVVSAWTLFFGKSLQLHAVEVKGEDLLSEEQVLSASAAPFGEQLVWVNTDDIAQQIELLSPVAEVEVTKRWPDGLVIEVKEREAVAALRVGSAIKGFDESGVIFRDYPAVPADLPQVSIENEVDAEVLAESAKVARSLPGELRRKVDLIEVMSLDRITLRLGDGRPVAWGSAQESNLKARVLLALLKQDAASYDVSVPSQPTFRR
jgi:cell division protein FtsQ